MQQRLERNRGNCGISCDVRKSKAQKVNSEKQKRKLCATLGDDGRVLATHQTPVKTLSKPPAPPVKTPPPEF